MLLIKMDSRTKIIGLAGVVLGAGLFVNSCRSKPNATERAHSDRAGLVRKAADNEYSEILHFNLSYLAYYKKYFSERLDKVSKGYAIAIDEARTARDNMAWAKKVVYAVNGPDPYTRFINETKDKDHNPIGIKLQIENYKPKKIESKPKKVRKRRRRHSVSVTKVREQANTKNNENDFSYKPPVREGDPLLNFYKKALEEHVQGCVDNGALGKFGFTYVLDSEGKFNRIVVRESKGRLNPLNCAMSLKEILAENNVPAPDGIYNGIEFDLGGE